ncbi:MAG: hypothetical protein F6K35_31465 [Okeania sp. SIO2H7]|nr:hypothetical protein [Okeania sp. SIO2H7]
MPRNAHFTMLTFQANSPARKRVGCQPTRRHSPSGGSIYDSKSCRKIGAAWSFIKSYQI